MLNALFITDIGQNMLKNDHLASVGSGDLQAALGHGGEQTKGLDTHCLAAGVGAGYDDGVHISADGKGHRHGCVSVEQRMPGPQDLCLALFQQPGTHTPHFIAQLAPGKDEIQTAQQLIVPANGACKLGGIGRKLRQNALDLGFFLAGQDADVVVQFHYSRRLDKQGRAAGAGVVDHSREGSAVFGLYRHNKPAVSLCDDIILQRLGIAGSDLGQYIPDL